MTKIYAKHLPYLNGHLGEVIEDMKLAGQPTIRVVKFGEYLCALEASHRLASAHMLGLIPKLVIQETEDNPVPDCYWDRVLQTLPSYEFDYVLKLNLGDFNRKE